MKIVISGYYGFDNVGDEAILLSMIQAFKLYDPTIEIIVLSNTPERTKLEFNVDAVNRWNIKAIFQALKGSDGLISGGGSLLQDEIGMNSIIYYTGIIKMAEYLKTPVFIYAQGIGPLRSSIGKRLVKYALKKTKITVRDLYSMRLLRKIGIEKEVEIVPDPVLGLKVDNGFMDGKWWKNKSISDQVVTVSVRDWPSAAGYKLKIAKALDKLVQRGIQIVFIPMHGKYDHETSKEVSKLMRENSLIAPFDASIEEKMSMINQSDALIGMRLHALIFSALTYTPFAALSYDPKIDAFVQISEQEVVGHVAKNDWTTESLYEQITSILKNSESEKMRLQSIMKPLQKRAMNTAEKAIQYISFPNKC